ncbi:large ribosomal subunit protein P2-like [Saccopteryx bilineata]|uniref:large ribosomal subunit protein P2-like n=1 Tax=Saccopteryx bilineata TaxID=59482 RepID=UPI00338F8DE5
MHFVASYLLAAHWGIDSLSTKDIKKILNNMDLEADDHQLSKEISELNRKKKKPSKMSLPWPAFLLTGLWLSLPSQSLQLASVVGFATVIAEKKDEKEEEEDDRSFD